MSHIEDRWKRAERKGTGKRWRARFVAPDRRERSMSFDRKVDAERWLTTLAADAHRGLFIDPSDRTTVAEYARQWAAARPHKATTATSVSVKIELHIASTAIGHRRLASLRTSDVQAWATERGNHLAPSTLKVLVSLLASIMKSAVADRLLAVSPVSNIGLPEEGHKRVVPLTVAQVRSLVDCVPDRCRAMVVVQAGLGLRVGELLALRRQDIDFEDGMVRVEWQLTQDGKRREDPENALVKACDPAS